MKKINGVVAKERLVPPEGKEFVFSNNERMLFRAGRLDKKQIRVVVNRLDNFAHYVINKSDKHVILPSDLRYQIKDQVEDLNNKDLILRFYLRFGADIISEERLRELANPSWVCDKLWIPETTSESYTVDELNGYGTGISVMGMLQNAKRFNRCDSVLMLPDHPLDKDPSDEENSDKITTKQACKEFIKTQPFDGLEISQTDHRDIMSMYAMDKKDNIIDDKVILASGTMVTDLKDRFIDNELCFGCVSGQGMLWLDRTEDITLPYVGVGFSVELTV